MIKEPIGKSKDILSEADLAAYCPDLLDWPASWCCEQRDLIAGEHIVALFKPFLLHLLGQGLARKTINLHRDNLWLLGGEIIRDLNETPKLRKHPVKEWISAAVDGGEGPLIYGCTSEQEQRSFDSTCRKLHRFLMTS